MGKVWAPRAATAWKGVTPWIFFRSAPLPKENKTTGFQGEDSKHVGPQGNYSLEGGNPLGFFSRQPLLPRRIKPQRLRKRMGKSVDPHGSYGLEGGYPTP